MRLTLVLLAAGALAAALAVQAGAATPKPKPRVAKPVVVWKTTQFGRILATRKHLALYTWNREPRGKIRCTGVCAKEWPPLVVPKGTRVARKVKGVMGVFGTIRRPDGRIQVTIDGRPLYTYEHDSPTRILCDDVDGWFVKRA